MPIKRAACPSALYRLKLPPRSEIGGLGACGGVHKEKSPSSSWAAKAPNTCMPNHSGRRAGASTWASSSRIDCASFGKGVNQRLTAALSCDSSIDRLQLPANRSNYGALALSLGAGCCWPLAHRPRKFSEQQLNHAPTQGVPSRPPSQDSLHRSIDRSIDRWARSSRIDRVGAS